MVSAAIARGTGAAGSGSLTYSFWVDGTDLVNYLDWKSVSIQMTARASDNSRATFRLENFDGNLDMLDFWGFGWQTAYGPVSYPLREVRLHYHPYNETLFGGYITGIRMGIGYANKSYIELDCVGYSWVLDASFVPVAVTFLAVDSPTLADCVQRLVGIAGLRGEVSARTMVDGVNDWRSDPGTTSLDAQQQIFNDVTISAYTPLRQAIMAVTAGANSAVGLFVDNNKRLCLVLDETTNNGSGLDIGPSGLSGGAFTLELQADFTEYVDHVYVQSSSAEGRGWYENRLSAGTSFVNQPSSFNTYQSPLRIDATFSNDLATEAFTREVYGETYLSEAQAGTQASYRITKALAWADLGRAVRVGEYVQIRYPQLGYVSGNQLYIIVSFTLRFLRPDYPVYELTCVSPHQWGISGFATAVSDQAATSAEYAKRRLTVRTS